MLCSYMGGDGPLGGCLPFLPKAFHEGVPSVSSANSEPLFRIIAKRVGPGSGFDAFMVQKVS
jgi:hypothetical protein